MLGWCCAMWSMASGQTWVLRALYTCFPARPSPVDRLLLSAELNAKHHAVARSHGSTDDKTRPTYSDIVSKPPNTDPKTINRVSRFREQAIRLCEHVELSMAWASVDGKPIYRDTYWSAIDAQASILSNTSAYQVGDIGNSVNLIRGCHWWRRRRKVGRAARCG